MNSDPHRPQYHFMPPSGWMNDPNGPIYWKGEYHLFYQHAPGSPPWKRMHWGHAVSRDLVHWTHLPIALSPTPGGPDKDGVWSGCAVDNEGVPTLIYTGVHPQVQCVATSRDGMLTWEKHPQNPVVAAPPEGMEVTGFRDPCVWREKEAWYMLIGSGIKDVGGTVLLYRSNNLLQWEYLRPLCTGDKAETGEMWECPDFFPLGDRQVLLVSVLRTTLYFVGTYRDHRFTPELRGNIDFGGHFYAAKSFLDGQERRILWGWIWEGRTAEQQQAAGWAGVMSLPRVLSLGPDQRMRIGPAPELKVLRRRCQSYASVRIPADEVRGLDEVGGDCLEIAAEVHPGAADEVGVKLRCSPDGSEETCVVWNPGAGTLTLDCSRSSLADSAQREVRTGPLRQPATEPLRLRLFLDRSVIEVFAGGSLCLTGRIYPTRPDSLGLALFARGGEAVFERVDVWQMGAIWGN